MKINIQIFITEKTFLQDPYIWLTVVTYPKHISFPPIFSIISKLGLTDLQISNAENLQPCNLVTQEKKKKSHSTKVAYFTTL